MFELIITAYLGVMSLAGFTVMGADKKRARNNQYRISEKTLWGITLTGGAVGTYFGMTHFRHKTKHAAFKFGLPVFAFLTVVILLYIWAGTPGF
ncbi:DUF1294 domain-containing protein [Jeotgalibacillus proteolyticus]|uniref:DUF1294 domain-containing protein n=1 Tax=Jeotgalibacillus proteolyticus TaxID=2082395 RepID=A0A2S5GEX5_9BACL|nr:DUF1294 domain-containing protein [Jeotgalibacillus proteolyticus]PPA71597.1 DUF1294 domain-containing protein [Jeotgalibacillus proteolyticus]